MFWQPLPAKELNYQERRKNRLRISCSLANYRKIQSLKGCHRGEQCVLLATGPSLGLVDLSLIENHPFVMGVNGAYRARNRFKYYFCSSSNFYIPNSEDIHKVAADYLFFSSLISYRKYPRVIYLKLDEKSIDKRGPMGAFHANLFRTLSWGPTALLDLVFPAVLWMGFSEVVLLGADYSLSDYGYFYDKNEDKRLFERPHRDEEMRVAHERFGLLRASLKKSRRPVKVYNCSPLTSLPHFEKRGLDEVIRKF